MKWSNSSGPSVQPCKGLLNCGKALLVGHILNSEFSQVTQNDASILSRLRFISGEKCSNGRIADLPYQDECLFRTFQLLFQLCIRHIITSRKDTLAISTNQFNPCTNDGLKKALLFVLFVPVERSDLLAESTRRANRQGAARDRGR